MRHTREDIAAFQGDDESRMVFARRADIPDGPLLYLPQGEAAQHRHLKGALLCPMPNCDDRALTVVSRAPARRDGFRHLHAPTGDHSVESLEHLQGKAAILRWLTGLQADGRLDPKVTFDAEVPVGGRERIADVLVTWPSGQRHAIEVQYSALSVEAWHERQTSYARHGVTVTWLLGHRRPHLNLYDGVTRLGDVHRAIIETGQPLLWINPAEMKIAMGYRSASAEPVAQEPAVEYWRRPSSEDTLVDVQPLPMADWSISPDGFTCAALERLDASSRDLAAAKARRREAEAAAAAKQRLVEAARLQAARARGARAAAQRSSEWGNAYPRVNPVPPGKALYRDGQWWCFVCGSLISEEAAEVLGGCADWCVEVPAGAWTRARPAAVEPPDEQLSLFE